MSTTIRIPIDGEEQDRDIAITYGLHIAKGWELAARIYARCEPAKPGPQPAFHNVRSNLERTKVSFRELERKTGRSVANISKHWHQWRDAIDDGLAVEVAPGDVVTLPDKEYAPTRNGGGLDDGVVANAPAEQKVEVIQKLMQRDPEVAARVENAFVQKAATDPSLHNRVRTAYEEFNPVPIQPERPNSLFNTTGFGAVVYRAVERLRPDLENLVRAIEAEQSGERTEEMARHEIDTLEQTERLIREEYVGAIRTAAGISYDATFERLMGRQG